MHQTITFDATHEDDDLSPSLRRVQAVYKLWADTAVESLNRDGWIAPSMSGVRFVSGDTLSHVLIDAPYVKQMVETEGGQEELAKFARSLLFDDAMRESMTKQGFQPADMVVFVAEVLITAASSSVAPSEAVVVAVHTHFGTFRGLCPVVEQGEKRVASIGEISLRPVVGNSALAALPNSETEQVLATRSPHDIHHPTQGVQ